MSNTMCTHIDAEAIARDGFQIIRGCFERQEAAQIKQMAQGLFHYPDTGVEVYMPGNWPQGMLDVCASSKIGDMLRQAGLSEPEFLSVKTVIKDQAHSFASPWHQDRPYWGGSDKYSLWIALDDCSIENGCLRAVPGSHSDGYIEHAASDDNKFQNRLGDDRIDESKVIDVLMQAGDALLFHDCLFHASHPNTTSQDRWSLIATYRDADVHDESTLWSAALGL